MALALLKPLKRTCWSAPRGFRCLDVCAAPYLADFLRVLTW